MTDRVVLSRRRLLGTLGFGVTAALLGAPRRGLAASPAGTQLASLSPDEVSAVSRIERYLNDIKTLKARFVQVSSNGGYAEGNVYVERPGHMRFDYDPPSPVLMIANGLTLLYYDKELKQATFLPLWDTPLWFLIRKEVSLDQKKVEIVKIEEALGVLRIALRDASSPDSGTVTLVFSDDPLALKKWEVVDPQGIHTQVSLVNPVYGEKIDPELFKYGNLEIYNRGRQQDQ